MFIIGMLVCLVRVFIGLLGLLLFFKFFLFFSFLDFLNKFNKDLFLRLLLSLLGYVFIFLNLFFVLICMKFGLDIDLVRVFFRVFLLNFFFIFFIEGLGLVLIDFLSLLIL